MTRDEITIPRAALAQQVEPACPHIVSTREGTHHCALSVRQPLTDEEITEIFESKTRWHYPPIGATDREFARDIERAHGIGGNCGEV